MTILSTSITGLSCKHPFLKEVQLEAPFVCNECQEIGYDSAYACSRGCDYHKHKECVMPSPKSSHPFFNNNVFTFHRVLPKGCTGFCEACGRRVKGFVYVCDNSKAYNYTIFLHPSCMNLPQVMNGTEECMVLKEKLDETAICECCERRQIGEEIKGWAYVSTCGNFACHIKCMKHMILEDTRVDNNREDMASTSTSTLTISAAQASTSMLRTGFTRPPNNGTSRELIVVGPRPGPVMKLKKYWKLSKTAIRLMVKALFFGTHVDVVADNIHSVLYN